MTGHNQFQCDDHCLAFFRTRLSPVPLLSLPNLCTEEAPLQKLLTPETRPRLGICIGQMISWGPRGLILTRRMRCVWFSFVRETPSNGKYRKQSHQWVLITSTKMHLYREKKKRQA
ncbi:hypothetical protein XELAEV_18042646mg [Xenopus laevis]|uniref:Uncharacterized protein n=1 Tax=Xenopus laevis TaxID=8355 RepID=A0A974C445_XENLA|nr:hypothetical protein XELAEV_18042646mg [Xenopus laevis]